jgi:hypothetical protein
MFFSLSSPSLLHVSLFCLSLFSPSLPSLSPSHLNYISETALEVIALYEEEEGEGEEEGE